jgi:hypothetical protein
MFVRVINIRVLFSIEKVKILLFGLLTLLLIFPVPNGINKISLVAAIINRANSLLPAHDPRGTLLVTTLFIEFHHLWLLLFHQ